MNRLAAALDARDQFRLRLEDLADAVEDQLDLPERIWGDLAAQERGAVEVTRRVEEALKAARAALEQP